jgi:predicted CXXCH cytochrome family protein
LLCTTCHDPHRARRGADAQRHYTAACRSCHADVHSDGEGLVRATDCVACHMPKRRADDAVHVVITDHWIRRSPPPSSLELKPEKHGRYVGPVRLYYPPTLSLGQSSGSRVPRARRVDR